MLSPEHLLLQLPLACFVLNQLGTIIYTNTKQKVEEMTVEELFEPEIRSTCLGFVRNVLEDRKSHQFSFKKGKTGEIVYITFAPADEGALITFYEGNLSFRDTSSRKVLEQQLADSEARLSAIFDILPVAIAVAQRDGTFIYANSEMDKFIPGRKMPSVDENALPGWKALSESGRWLAPSEFPGARASRGEAVKPGVEMLYTNASGEEFWTKVAAVPLYDADDRINGQVVLIHDISDLKNTMQATFDSVTEMIQVFKALRNEEGIIVDFIWILNNKSSEKIYGNVIGKRLLEHNPGVVEAGIFSHFKEVVETGIPMQYEKHYQSEQFDGWFHQSVVKLNDGVATTTTDISARKKSEANVHKHLMLLSQSEMIAQSGSWEYDPEHDQFYWSEGMYRLFGFAPDTAVKPDVMVDKATAKYKAKARKFVRQLISASSDVEAVLEFNVNGKLMVHHIKAIVSSANVESGKNKRILGINFDISNRIQLENKNKKLVQGQYELKAKQRLELLTTILDVQEEERTRLAESLHNGLSQTLFGLLLTLKQLEPANGIWTNENTDALLKTQQILRDAITESRRISHELTPQILQLVGLEAAINKMCANFSSSFNIKTSFENITHKRPPYLEMVIYRTVQELLLNATKHASAQNIDISVGFSNRVFTIKVQDDGKGFPQKGSNEGIGLANIRLKARLLNGAVHILSGNGLTEIIVRISSK